MSCFEEKCDNCKRSSYNLFKNKSCPYCSPEHFINRMVSGISKNFNFKKYAKKYNINLSDEEIKNRVLSIVIFENNEESREDLKEILKKYGHTNS